MASPDNPRPEAVLAISLDRVRGGTDNPDDLVLQFRTPGRDPREFRVPAEGAAPSPPATGGWSSVMDDSITLPDEGVISHLIAGLEESALALDVPLWLEFGSPCGDLPARRWEAMLQPKLGRPILRLSPSPLTPFASPDPLDVVVIASSPLAKDELPIVQYVNDVVRSMLRSGNVDVTAHVFADLRFYPALRERLADVESGGDGPGAIVYDPASAQRYAAARRVEGIEDRPESVTNPWLQWVCHSLPSDRAADVVHFVGHGYRAVDRGAMAVSSSPVVDVDTSWARFVGPQQASSFMTQLGAWSMGMGTVASSPGASGLRLLAHYLARSTQGPVFYHEFPEGPDLNDPTGLVYDFLTQSGATPPPASGRLVLYSNPAQFAEVSESSPTAAVRGLTLDNPRTGKLFADGQRPPRWVALAQRQLEKSVADLMSRGGPVDGSEEKASTMDVPTQALASDRRGIEDALRYLSDLVGRHSAAASDGTAPSRTALALLQTADDLGTARDVAVREFSRLQSELDEHSAVSASRCLALYVRSLENTRQLVANVLAQETLAGDLPARLGNLVSAIATHFQHVEAVNQWVARIGSTLSFFGSSALPGLRGSLTRALEATVGALVSISQRAAIRVLAWMGQRYVLSHRDLEWRFDDYRRQHDAALRQAVAATAPFKARLRDELATFLGESSPILVGMRESSLRLLHRPPKTGGE